MQALINLLYFIRKSLLEIFEHDDQWFLILDSSPLQTQQNSLQSKTIPNELLEQPASHEGSGHFIGNALTLKEAWSILNPWSMLKFLRYSLSDVI